jgi:hypothetical protein
MYFHENLQERSHPADIVDLGVERRWPEVDQDDRDRQSALFKYTWREWERERAGDESVGGGRRRRSRSRLRC